MVFFQCYVSLPELYSTVRHGFSMALIEIDALPITHMVIFNGYVKSCPEGKLNYQRVDVMWLDRPKFRPLKSKKRRTTEKR